MCIIQKFFAAIDKKWILSKMNKYNVTKCVFIIYNSTSNSSQLLSDDDLEYDVVLGGNCVRITVTHKNVPETISVYSREFLPADLKILTLKKELNDVKLKLMETEYTLYSNFQ